MKIKFTLLVFIFSTVFIAQTFDSFCKNITQYGSEFEIIFPSDVDYRNEKLYVLDNKMNSVSIYNLNGDLNKHLEFTKGNGPGEFSMGVFKMAVINDSLIALYNDFKLEIFFVDHNGKYIRSFKLNEQINDLFWKDELLHLVTINKKYVIKKVDLEGRCIGKDIPSPKRDKDEIPGIPKVCYDDNKYYYTNPYKDEIFCFTKENVWKFKSGVPLVDVPRYSDKKAMRLKSWARIITYKDFIIATTYDYLKNNSNESLNSSQILIIDKNNGELIKRLKCDKGEFLYSFNGKDLFRYYREPFPHIKKIDLNLSNLSSSE